MNIVYTFYDYSNLIQDLWNQSRKLMRWNGNAPSLCSNNHQKKFDKNSKKSNFPINLFSAQLQSDAVHASNIIIDRALYYSYLTVTATSERWWTFSTFSSIIHHLILMLVLIISPIDYHNVTMFNDLSHRTKYRRCESAIFCVSHFIFFPSQKWTKKTREIKKASTSNKFQAVTTDSQKLYPYRKFGEIAISTYCWWFHINVLFFSHFHSPCKS